MKGTITIQAPALAGRTPAQLTLAAGQSATFGVCHCGACDLDLRVEAAGHPAIAGRITATTGFWLVSNLSDAVPVTVENMEDWYQYLIVEPGRRDVPVPFELAQIDLTAAPSGPKIAVFGYEPRYAAGRRSPAACVAAGGTPPLLDSRSTYFSVLRELCRHRLSGGIETSLPTSVEIAENLRRRHRSISPRAVDAHIKYVSEKLGLPKGAGREALVSVVIRSHLLGAK